MELKGEIVKSTAMVGDFRTTFSVIDRTIRQKIARNIEDLNKTITQFYLVGIY